MKRKVGSQPASQKQTLCYCSTRTISRGSLTRGINQGA